MHRLFYPWLSPMCFLVVSLEGRALHLATLVQEAEQRVLELQAQVGSEAPGEREGSDRDRQLKAWEWRLRLFRRMQTGFEHASKASGRLWWFLLTALVFLQPVSLLAFCLGWVNSFHTGKPSIRLLECKHSMPVFLLHFFIGISWQAQWQSRLPHSESRHTYTHAFLPPTQTILNFHEKKVPIFVIPHPCIGNMYSIWNYTAHVTIHDHN